MTTTTAPARFRYLGVTDECVECQQCGKSDLRSTVVLAVLDADGNTTGTTYYGSHCAARALGVPGGGRAVTRSAVYAHHDTLMAAADARRMLAHYGLPEQGEPTAEQTRDAMGRYIQAHPNIADRVARTGIGVRAMVADMLSRKRAALAAAALVADRCPHCDTTH